jgi:hypothetical protein
MFRILTFIMYAILVTVCFSVLVGLATVLWADIRAEWKYKNKL